MVIPTTLVATGMSVEQNKAVCPVVLKKISMRVEQNKSNTLVCPVVQSCLSTEDYIWGIKKNGQELHFVGGMLTITVIRYTD